MVPAIYRPYPRRLRESSHLQMSSQRQHFSPQLILKTPSVGLGGGLNPQPPAQKPSAPPTELRIWAPGWGTFAFLL